MPPCSTNRSTIQRACHSFLRLALTTRCLCLYPEPDETICSRPGNKRWKERDDWKKKLNVAATGGKSRIWYRIFVLSQGGDRHGERAREEKRRGRNEREREQCGHACCLLVYLSSPSSHPTTGGQLSTEPRLPQKLHTHTHTHVMNMKTSQQRGRSLYFQLLTTYESCKSTLTLLYKLPDSWLIWLLENGTIIEWHTWNTVHTTCLYP